MLSAPQIAILLTVSRVRGTKSVVVREVQAKYPDPRYQEALWLREIDALLDLGYLEYPGFQLRATEEGVREVRQTASVLMPLVSEARCL